MKRGAGLHSCNEKEIAALVEGNLNLVYFVARRYKHMGIGFEDLVAEGRVGLVAAARKFDPTPGVPFGTYAFNHIRSRIRNAIASKSQTIRRPWARPGHAECPVIPVCSLEAFPEDAFPTDEWQAVRDIEQALDEPKIESLIEQALATLTNREAFVVAHSFGLEAPRSGYQSIGTTLGLTRERVRQIREKAIRKLKKLSYLREAALN